MEATSSAASVQPTLGLVLDLATTEGPVYLPRHVLVPVFALLAAEAQNANQCRRRACPSLRNSAAVDLAAADLSAADSAVDDSVVDDSVAADAWEMVP